MTKIFALTLMLVTNFLFSVSPLLATGYTLETKSVEQISEAMTVEDEPDPMEEEDAQSVDEISEAIPFEDEPDSMEKEDGLRPLNE